MDRPNPQDCAGLAREFDPAALTKSVTAELEEAFKWPSGSDGEAVLTLPEWATRGPARAPERRLRRLAPAPVGALVAACLMGFGIGAAYQSLSQHRARLPEPARAHAPSPGASSAASAGLRVEVRNAEAAPAGRRGAAAQGADLLMTFGASQPSSIGGKRQLSARAEAPSVHEAPTGAAANATSLSAATPEGAATAPPREDVCAEPGVECAELEVAGAEATVRASYREARRAGVPMAVLRADQARWRSIRDAAAAQSRSALADAYDRWIDHVEDLADGARNLGEADRDSASGAYPGWPDR